MRLYGGRESTRLARALETAAPSGDPAVDELVKITRRLSQMTLDDQPDPAFRAATRHRVLALAEQREAAPDRRPAPHAGPARHAVPARRLTGLAWGRQFAAAVAVLAVVLATAGVLTIASRDALPGDALYAVKRGAEQAQLGLTRDVDDRGLTLLHFAENRLDEVTELVQSPGALGVGTPGRPLAAGAGSPEAVLRTLADMDRQTEAGISLLTAFAVNRSDEVTLGILPVWAAGQQDLLDALVAQMTQPVQERAQVSLALLERVDERARTLGLALPRDCLDDTAADELGPVPCESSPPGRGGGPAPTPSSPGARPSETSIQPAPSSTPPSSTPPSSTPPSSTPPSSTPPSLTS